VFKILTVGRRFLYVNKDQGTNINQLAVLDLNPMSPGAAPMVTGPTLAPASLPRDGSVIGTLTARVSGGGTLVRVGTAVLLAGVEDRGEVASKLRLRDDGMEGDRTANDGVFTAVGLRAGLTATPGPRLIRVKAESKSPDGRRHATAIDVGGLEVK
jgi:hypothetical protein